MRIHDISPVVGPRTVSWRDTFPVQVTWHSRTDAGDATTNSTWRLHAHTGTHLDAPSHHLAGGAAVAGTNLDAGLGPCRVVEVDDEGGTIGAEQLRVVRPRSGERLLLRTTNSRRNLWEFPGFTADYTGLSAEAAKYLVDVGVRLIGIDYLSVELFEERGAPAHRTLLAAGVAVLEGLTLAEIAPGEYTLVFLPLRLAEAEAAPGRAVLVEDHVCTGGTG